MGVFKGYQPNIFRAVSGSLFSTTANWSRGYVPTGSDVADIRDNCVIDVSRTIGSLVVRAPFTASINTGLTLNVKDIIDVKGHLSCSGAPNIISEARKNNINSLLAASSSFFYSGSNQNVPGISYYNLIISNNGTKTIIGDTIVSNNLTIQPTNNTTPASILELSRYNLIVSGTTSVNGLNSNTQTAAINKSGFGNVLFTNALIFGFRAASAFDFSIGNPNVELRNGIGFSQNLVGFLGYNFKSGIGIWSFTTNNQTIDGVASGQVTITFDAPMIIGSGVSLKIGTNITNYNNLQIGKYINGVSSSSALVNVGNIVFTSKEAIETSMSTGSVDFTSSINTITIGGNYSATIPARFNAFRDLSVSGTGIKTLGTSSFISGTLTTNSSGILELSSSNLIVSGTTSIASTNGLTKSGPGNITFIGRPTINNPYNINLSGNPNVECRNGIQNQSNITSNLGTGSWTFSTNNQDLTWGGSGNTSEFYNVIVSGSIVVNGKSNYVAIRNSLNGTEAGSTFVNSGSLYLFFGSTPMLTGSLIIPTGSSNLVGYYVSGAFTVPRTAYYDLAVGGGGEKTLSGNTTIYRDLTISAALTSSLECLGYNLIVSGTTTVGGDGGYTNIPSLNISGSGSIVFKGLFYIANAGNILFPGNPNIELQGGVQFQSNNNPNPGTGSWTFTTNNQNLIFGGSGVSYNIYNMTVSGAITLTYSGDTLYLINSVNGTDANSKILMTANSVINYYGSSTPMSTGILDATSSLNTTFIYATGSQDIRGGTYRNLTMLSGTKTLQGNVSVLNTLSTGSGATLATINLNGFTLTNP